MDRVRIREGEEREPAQRSATVQAAAAAVGQLLRPRWQGSVAVVALYIVVHALLAFGDGASVVNAPVTLLALVSVSLAVVLLALPAPNPIPRLWAVGVLILSGVTAALEYSQAWPENPSPFAHWHLGAITIVLLALAVRGRLGAAWIGYAGLFAGTVAWALLNGLTIGDGVGLIIRHAGTLLAGTLFEVGRRRTTKSLVAMNEARAARDYTQANAIAAIDERERQMAHVNAMARPLLERLTGSDALGATERAECLLVEASLRDAMRGGSLFVEPVITAARAARARGVEVALLDDRGEPTDAEVAAVAAIVAAELHSTPSGRFTARVLPEGREDLATIVVESGTHRMLMVSPEGDVRATSDQAV